MARWKSVMITCSFPSFFKSEGKKVENSRIKEDSVNSNKRVCSEIGRNE